MISAWRRCMRLLLSGLGFLVAWLLSSMVASVMSYLGGYGVLGGAKPRNAIGMIVALHTALGIGALIIHSVTALWLSHRWNVQSVRPSTSALCGVVSFVMFMVAEMAVSPFTDSTESFLLVLAIILVLATFFTLMWALRARPQQSE